MERVRAGFAALNRGDLDETASVLHRDAVWIPYLGMLEKEIYEGRDAIMTMVADLREHLSGFQVEPKEFIDRGDQVVVVVEASGVGSGSGAEVTQRWAQLWSMRGGLAVRVEAFESRAEALEAAGLQE